MLRIRLKYLVLLPLLAGFLAAQIVQAATAPPGSVNNPVVSRSYVEKALQPLRDEISRLAAEVAALKAQRAVKFDDVPTTHWAYDSITYMVNKNIVKGVGAGKFAPGSQTTRAQLAVMIVNALQLPTTGVKAEFTDVPASHWAYSYIAAAQKTGIISGNDGKFRPNDSVTRGEMAAMLVRAFHLERLNKAASYSDVQPGYWAYDLIMRLADNGISSGYEDGTFRPANKISRAEVCVLLARSMDPARRKN